MNEFWQFTKAVAVISAVGFPAFFGLIELTRDEEVSDAAEKVRHAPALQVCVDTLSSCAGAFIKVSAGPRWQGWPCAYTGDEGCLVVVGGGYERDNGIPLWQLRRILREGEYGPFVSRWEWMVFPDSRQVVFAGTSTTTVPSWDTLAAEFVRQQYVRVP